MSFDKVLPALGEAYDQWKAHEKEKNKQKEEFFKLADRELEIQGLAEKVVTVWSSDDPIERATLHYPGWNIVEWHPMEGNLFKVILREEPSFKPFAWEHDGVKYARTIRKGAVMVDDDWLAEADPDLYAEVTYVLPWGTRIMSPLENMERDTIAKLTKYIYNAKPTISLSAPREIKE